MAKKRKRAYVMRYTRERMYLLMHSRYENEEYYVQSDGDLAIIITPIKYLLIRFMIFFKTGKWPKTIIKGEYFK